MKPDSQLPPSRDRENPDPHELNKPVPYVIIALVLALLAWAVVYIVLQAPDGGASSLVG